jgi:hypothetical protein
MIGVFIRHKQKQSSVAGRTTERACSPSRAVDLPGKFTAHKWELRSDKLLKLLPIRLWVCNALLLCCLLLDVTGHSGCLDGKQPVLLLLSIGGCYVQEVAF